MTSFTEAWGGGSGRVQALVPSARLVCGACALASCAVVPLNKSFGVALFLCVLVAWTIFCGLPLQRLAGLLRFSVFLFMPLFLLVPFSWVQRGGDVFSKVLCVTLVIGLRGTACIVVCAATMSSVELAEFGQGLAGLRLPRVVTALVVQIAHQTALLADEVQRLVSALRVRGVASASMVARLRCLFALPVIWLLRMLQRAERVSAAMEMRGFKGPLCVDRDYFSAHDVCAMTVALVLFMAVVFVSLGVR